MWIIPSYNRADQCRDLINIMRTHGADAKIVKCINADDPQVAEYGGDVLTVPAGTVGAAEAFRVAFREFPNEPWYGVLGDDSAIETHGFEQRLVAAAGSWGIANGRDDRQPNRIHGAAVFGGDLVRSLGYIAPDGFQHLYVDDVWEMIGTELGNWRILQDVHTPHVWEPTSTTTVRANSTRENDSARYTQWLTDDAGSDIHRVRMAMWKAKGLSLDLARSRTVMLGFPVYERPSPQHEASAMDTAYLLAQLGIPCAHVHAIGKPIHEARNSIADAFLKSGMSDLVMIDSDMSWKAWDVVRLLATRHAVVAGVGRKRNDLSDSDPEAWCFNPISPTDIPCDQAGMAEVAQVGTGFMRINVRVFERLRDAHPEWRRRKNTEGTDHYTAFFRWTSEGEDDISEDIRFCRDYRALGGKIHIDPSIELGHYGTRNYKGRVSVLFT